jgi:hypothetical protein
MKRTFLFGLMILGLTIVCQSGLYAQGGKKKTSKNDEYFDDRGGFKHRLWYGGGFSLGFSGSGDCIGCYSLFQLGLSPMVGYKLIGDLSVGPRVSFLYNNIRVRVGNGNVESVNPVSWSVGVFTRYKFLNFLFAHAEYGIENRVNSIGIDFNDKVVFTRLQRNNAYLGLGYNGSSGSLWGFEIALLYNLNLPNNDIESPFDIRAGVTYNF